ncbi:MULTISPECIES: tRNA (cytidine(34)-2'-O)-methyltransferase [unclassified Guyparkeria]|uniref:tRNA (cytidine(34)-2'-O)-methyltransferase n=1 Tax=unclassified Guyparkeria TaxID=2626246 RepID=UPI000733692A|nr:MULTISPECIES: tRNA (cytidine(34)-2'-O)-methyltransferase [unclassified Guyparkeria]KTG16676.1 rRNA methylase [Guyparkeria sp. XI15]OAE85710.1 tRNA (cytosine(34)-2'-O)-methyltransferase TrmL [Guyparkeria sp. WRN-7]
MPSIMLFEPEIPPNTGNLIRLCANTGSALHLVEPLGFSLSDKALRRAGLDYHQLAHVHRHADLEQARAAAPGRMLAFSTRGTTRYDRIAYRPDDVLLFGPETRGLPDAVLEGLPESQRLYLPMVPDSRSLNLANAAAVAFFEAWRQLDFTGAT